MPETAAIIRAWQTRFEKILPGYLPEASRTPPLLQMAMNYSAVAGGKRIRPLFVYASGRALNLDENNLDGIAAAIELIHTYSLIHDDLPSMDDDDLRRGQPSCHRKFDEATAILAGDALQALAFEILAADPALSTNPQQQTAIILGLARACGASGMAGGQALDLDSLGKQISQAELEKIHAATAAARRSVGQLPAKRATGSPLRARWRRKLESGASDCSLSSPFADSGLDRSIDFSRFE